jgi:serine/threonine protein kinase
MMSLGPFVLIGVLGSGGMSVVYRAVHRHSRLPVAVKILTRELARQQRYRHAFRREVRAMSRLHHEGVAHIYDMGEVSAKEAAASGESMVEGSPWLAMQLVDGQPLASSSCMSGDWAQLRPVLVGLLEALAHAHAHGVLHCDLKPSNVLLLDSYVAKRAASSKTASVSGAEGTTPIKVIDFGLTRLLGPESSFPAEPSSQQESSEHMLVGTPPYMAPEQAHGEWRDQGPWTDLYAFGCLAWQQITGAPPFVREDLAATLDAHCHETLPAFAPRFEVPAGVESWLRRLLEKSCARRFRRAADALEALSPGANTVSDTMFSDTMFSDTTSSTDPASAPAPAIGVGLRLFGVREVPMASRERERALLTQALTEAVTTRSAQAVVLSGEAGYGKSRLARWLAIRAHGLGAVTVLHAVHSAHAGPRDGIEGGDQAPPSVWRPFRARARGSAELDL